MNGHIANKWARVPKAWEDPPDIDGMPLSYEDINKEENAASVNPPTKVSDAQQTMPFPQFVDSMKNLLEVAFTVLQREEQERELEWAEARDECLRVTEEGLSTLQHDVAKSLVTILDSLDRGQHLQRRARDAERRAEKERWRKSYAETEKWMKRLAEKSEGGRTEGWSCEKEEKEEEDVSGTCLEVEQQVQMAMDKAESEREDEITERYSTAAKQELAIMEVLMEQLGVVEETCGRHSKITQDRVAHLWQTIEKNRSVRRDNSGISEQYTSSVTPLAILEPCLVRGRRSLLPPITSLNEEAAKRSAIQNGTGTPTQGGMWHMEPQSENHREKKKRRKKKVEMKEGDEEEGVIERNEENENIRKNWKQRLTEWLHAPLCGCAVRCY